MDILMILENEANDLYAEDLDFFETELNVGNYDAAYVLQCKEKITAIRNRFFVHHSQAADSPKATEKADLSPKKCAESRSHPMAAGRNLDEQILQEIAFLRKYGRYKTEFKKYVRKENGIDAAFVEKHFAFLDAWELNAIISVKQMGEDFLEKYFDILDPKKIARYQRFSEAFFMKHYAQLDVTIVLTRGKNEWRKKEKRSKQLDVFLRLKGVQN